MLTARGPANFSCSHWREVAPSTAESDPSAAQMTTVCQKCVSLAAMQSAHEDHTLTAARKHACRRSTRRTRSACTSSTGRRPPKVPTRQSCMTSPRGIATTRRRRRSPRACDTPAGAAAAAAAAAAAIRLLMHCQCWRCRKPVEASAAPAQSRRARGDFPAFSCAQCRQFCVLLPSACHQATTFACTPSERRTELDDARKHHLVLV